jgi:flagellar biosynthesis anti-sigma factor FlgM
MRVDFTNLGLEPPERSKPGRAGQTGTSASVPVASDHSGADSQASAGVDRARFSFDQARVASLEARALAAPEVRQEKVVPLQEAVANGNYSVDAHKVADAIAAEAGNGRVR